MKATPHYKNQAVIDRQRLVNALAAKVREQMPLLEAMTSGDGRTIEYRKMRAKSDLLEQTIRELIDELHEAQPKEAA